MSDKCNCVEEKEKMCKEVHNVTVSLLGTNISELGKKRTMRFYEGNVNGTDLITISHCPFCGKEL